MKFNIIVLLVVCVGSVANAKIKRVDFERNTASSKTTNLSAAFQNAIQNSDSDLRSTKTTILVEENARVATWTNRKRERIVVQGTAAVDQYNIKASSKKISRESQLETEQSLKNDLKELHQ